MAAKVANPLLLGWVQEWVDQARERNSKGLLTYKNAYAALKACPITFGHPSELQQLKGFGPKLCDRLTEELKQHCEENGLPMPKRKRPSKAGQAAGDDDDDDDEGTHRPAKKPRKAKPYVPTLRSGPYALLLGLSSLDEEAAIGITKDQLIQEAQPHCDSSFTAPKDANSYYTAWSSMKTLLDKDLVSEKGRPTRRYMLTDEGWEVARRIKNTTTQTGRAPPNQSAQSTRPQPINLTGDHEDDCVEHDDAVDGPRNMGLDGAGEEQNYANVVSVGNGSTDTSTLPDFRPIRLAPGTFTVELVLDVREIRAKTDRDYMRDALSQKGVDPIMRSLELGDALWVAKCKDSNFLSRAGAEGDEIVLDWIVERKRLDDLIGSIKDGRFHEQKFRLKKSGVKNVIYIVEEMRMDAEGLSKYEEMVRSAIASTQVVNGYFLKKTQAMDDTVRYLARMTMLLKKQYEDKTLLVIPTEVLTAQNYLPLVAPNDSHYITYPAFASLSSKSELMTLRDLYLKMLMCTRQVTGERAIEIQKRWKTPSEFMQALRDCGEGSQGDKKRRELVFSQLGALPVQRKKVGKILSQRIADIWS
ncbi:crossover junction endonuclease MUS81 [Microdochium trichocladiopsis]|uniref:Crossover junction endonuclease MUS81 n=1 Tax=Microdochium trichocladiopsis TaxID=1682393 RepID=A0A9P9BQL3_9PEZI|nr:crossover junction endonuclease MUS81 [Microdochium trichocladiopsis]KAH7035008.1 crossover junction endonuclease MUS81 [Microdochium trichocladiopsis]